MKEILGLLALIFVMLSPLAVLPWLVYKKPAPQPEAGYHIEPIRPGQRGSSKAAQLPKVRKGITPEAQAKVLAGMSKQYALLARGLTNRSLR